MRQTTCPGFFDRDIFAEVIQGKFGSLPYSVLREIAVFCMHEVERVMKFGAALSAVEWNPNNRPEIASGSEDGHSVASLQALFWVYVPTTKAANFRWLVLVCVNADFCNQRLIFQHFSRSKRCAFFCTAPIAAI